MVQLDQDFIVVLPLRLDHGTKLLCLFCGPPFLGLGFGHRRIAGAKGRQCSREITVGLRAEDAAKHSRLVRGLWGAVQLCGDLRFAGF